MDTHMNKYECAECGKCFEAANHLASHRRSHSTHRLLECTVCGVRFTRSCSLVTHSEIHSGERPYKCYVCDKAFSQSATLQSHMRVHMSDKPHECSVCSRSFKRSSDLQLHVRCVHDNVRPYECDWCGRQFKINRELQRHLLTHTGSKLYPCTQCPKGYSRLILLKRHVIKKHSADAWDDLWPIFLLSEICRSGAVMILGLCEFGDTGGASMKHWRLRVWKRRIGVCHDASVRPVASLPLTGVVFLRFWTFLGFENRSSQRLSRGNLDFKKW